MGILLSLHSSIHLEIIKISRKNGFLYLTHFEKDSVMVRAKNKYIMFHNVQRDVVLSSRYSPSSEKCIPMRLEPWSYGTPGRGRDRLTEVSKGLIFLLDKGKDST